MLCCCATKNVLYTSLLLVLGQSVPKSSSHNNVVASISMLSIIFCLSWFIFALLSCIDAAICVSTCAFDPIRVQKSLSEITLHFLTGRF